MPSFRTEVSHQLGREAALQKLQEFMEQVQQRYEDQVSQLEGHWQENRLQFSLTTYGFEIDGTLTVEDETALLEGQLPFAALAFKGKIEKSIRKELERTLA